MPVRPMKAIMPDPVYLVADVQRLLKVGRSHVENLIDEGRLGAINIGLGECRRFYRIPKPDLQTYLLRSDLKVRLRASQPRPDHPVYLVSDVARLLKISPQQVLNTITAGKLGAFNVSLQKGCYRIPSTEFREYLRRQSTLSPTASHSATAVQASAEPHQGLRTFSPVPPQPCRVPTSGTTLQAAARAKIKGGSDFFRSSPGLIHAPRHRRQNSGGSKKSYN